MSDLIARSNTFRFFWGIIAGWIMYSKWNAPKGHEARSTLYQSILYGWSLAEMLDHGYMLPQEAIDEDRQYWTD